MAEITLTDTEFENLTNDIAAALDGTWTVEFVGRSRLDHRANLVRTEGDVTISISHNDYRGPSRLAARAVWGDDTPRGMSEGIRATVSIKREGAAIARDLQRRIIDPFIPRLIEARAEYQRQQERVTAGQALAAQIGSHLNATTEHALRHAVTPATVYDYLNPQAEFDVRYQRKIAVSAHLTNLTPEQGLALAAWVQANLVDSK